jgi:hypothetical protein
MGGRTATTSGLMNIQNHDGNVILSGPGLGRNALNITPNNYTTLRQSNDQGFENSLLDSEPRRSLTKP